jgi:hypothetical protein
MRIAPLSAALAALVLAQPGAAQEAGSAGLSIELNAARDGEAGCTLSFLVTNARSGDVEKAVFETVLFDTGGQVERLTLFDFGALPAGRPRVRQFTLPDTPCDGIGRILVNGASTCEADAPGACTEGLSLSSRSEIEVIG